VWNKLLLMLIIFASLYFSVFGQKQNNISNTEIQENSEISFIIVYPDSWHWKGQFLLSRALSVKCIKRRAVIEKKVIYREKSNYSKKVELLSVEKIKIKRYLSFWEKIFECKFFSLENYNFDEILDKELAPDDFEKELARKYKNLNTENLLVGEENYNFFVKVGENEKEVYIYDPYDVLDEKYIRIIKCFEDYFKPWKLSQWSLPSETP
jgi:hypothetical protein